jgi:hypothetical protein
MFRKRMGTKYGVEGREAWTTDAQEESRQQGARRSRIQDAAASLPQWLQTDTNRKSCYAHS